MEVSYVKYMDSKYLANLGFSEQQINTVSRLVCEGIQEKLYFKMRVPYHNMKHIERVIMYSMWILNEKKKKNGFLENSEILLLAALYHDCGRKYSSNKMHGIVGAQIAKEKLKGTLDEKIMNGICLLIETHACPIDTVNFKNYDYSKEEMENLQILSNILKDADALDRNRIKFFSFAQCNVNKLRTIEAKDIYVDSDVFYSEYKKAVKKLKSGKISKLFCCF